MAVHARFGGRNAGKGRIFHRGVAIPAVYAVIAHMVLVTERYWLVSCNADFSNKGRTVQCRRTGDYRCEKSDASKDAKSRDRVRAGVKDLRHSGSPEEGTELVELRVET